MRRWTISSRPHFDGIDGDRQGAGNLGKAGKRKRVWMSILRFLGQSPTDDIDDHAENPVKSSNGLPEHAEALLQHWIEDGVSSEPAAGLLSNSNRRS